MILLENDRGRRTRNGTTAFPKLWGWLVLALGSWGGFFGCVGESQQITSQKESRIVWSIRFIGNKNLPDSDILDAIEHTPTPLTVKLSRLRLFGRLSKIKSERILRSDVRRIKQLYRYHGFYNAKTSYRFRELTLTRPNTYRNYRRVELELKIDEGPQVVVRQMDLRVIPENHPNAALVKSELKKKLALELKGPFSTPKYRLTKGVIAKRLQDKSFAMVKLGGQVVVDKVNNVADVKIVIRPGPRCMFGSIVIRGNQRVQTELIKELFTFKEGGIYRVQSLVNTQRILSALGLFTTVDFKPALAQASQAKTGPCSSISSGGSANGGGLCPIDIRLELAEDRFQSIKLGLGAVIDGQRNQFEASVKWTWNHFFGGLRKLEFSFRPGLAFLPDIIRRFDVGPDAVSALTFTQPIFLKNRQAELGARLLYRYTAEVGDGDYQTFSPSVWFRIPLLQRLSVRLSWNLEFAFAVRNPITLERETYLLNYLEQQMVFDLRDDPLNTTRGFFASLTLQQSGLFGKFSYIKIAPEIRFFVPLPLKLVLAGRVQYGVLFSRRETTPEEAQEFAEADALLSESERRMRNIVRRSPLTQRFFAGGANSVRGWTARYLGPLACQIRSRRFAYTGRQENTRVNGQGQKSVRFVRSQENATSTLPGAGQITGGGRCVAEAGDVARSRFGDLAGRLGALPRNGRSGSFGLPAEELLQVIPMGGEQMIVASLELRVPLSFVSSYLGLVFFSDVGVVQSIPTFVEGDTVAPSLIPSISVGGGLRLFLPFGAIRVDVAARLFPDALRYPLQPDWSFHFAIGEAF